MQSLIEQVRKAANRMPIIKTVEPRPLGRRQDGIQFARPEEYDELDLRVVLAHLERKDAALRDFAAAWREVAHRSGVKLEAWEDDEYILSAPERGPCGMTIHRRHATVLNAALENLENNDGK